jgi:hypothetical protein
MLALARTCSTEGSCGNYVAANALGNELVALADKKGAPEWKTIGMLRQGWLLSLCGKAAESVQVITSGLANRIGTFDHPFFLSSLARAHAELGQFDDAWRCIGEAVMLIEKTKQRLHEAELHRIGGKSHSSRSRLIQKKQKRTSSVRSRWPVSSKQSPGNSAPQ